MLQLAISTSTSHGSICLADGDQVLFESEWQRTQSHAEILGPQLQEAFQKTNLQTTDLNLVSCDVGPGSFTGVRIAVSTAKTLAYANRIPVAAASSLYLLAKACKTQLPILAISNAQRQEVYGALYKPEEDDITEVIAPELMSLERLENLVTTPTLFVGDGYDLLKDEFSDRLIELCQRQTKTKDHPTATTLSQVGLAHQKLNKTLEWKLLEPLYIRLSAAEEKLARGELKRHV